MKVKIYFQTSGIRDGSRTIIGEYFMMFPTNAQ